ncbi:hypothetical protein Patl1_29170 [Pistacia atlantica]|uniref:Uncharacterized protein n=1 Tax=Pistacia atlantica TaxID=434234 RepID=A0ACC1BDF4_9ROSI|nr:hypothetical protein Patl1_29170 [Pistacia atlantica]
MPSYKMKNNNVVSQFKHRKNLLKLTLETRDALANAQCRYNLCILAVAKSLRLITSRNSSPCCDLTSYPFLESHETTDNHNIKTMSRKQTRIESNLEASTSSSSSSQPSKPKRSSFSFKKDKRKQAFSYSSQPSKPTCPSSSSRKDKGKKKLHRENDLKFETILEETGEGEDADDDEVAQAQAKPSPEPPLERDDVPGWDFFRPYDGLKAERESDVSQSNDEDHLRMVRTEERIPELEKVGERDRKEANSNESERETRSFKTETDGKVDADADANDGEIKNKNSLMIVNGGGTSQKDLLQALKEIEEHFLRAFESGLEVSKMLEVKKFHLQKGWERVIGGSSNFFASMRRARSISSRSSSCLSILSPSRTRTSASWDEFRREPFLDDYVPMQSGSHAFTLSKLYAWEKILYQDVSIGEKCRKRFDRKCFKLRNEEAGEGLFNGDRTRSKVRELHASIYVSVRGATSTSDKIIKVKDEELHPQIVELLQGMKNNCKVMCELHEAQSKVMFEVGSFNCPSYGGFSYKSNCHATHLLGKRVESWRACFSEYISAQKAYLDALSKWISKCCDIKPGNEGNNDPPLLVMVKDWKTNLDMLPHKEVTKCMKSFVNDIRKVYVQQCKEQDQMRKVVKMTAKLDKKAVELKKLQDKVLASEISSTKEAVQFKFDDGYERLTEKRNSLATYKNRLEKHKAKHISGVQKTQMLTLQRMQTGFSNVFESLVNFSKASAQMYADLAAYNGNAKVTCGTMATQLR